MELWAELLPGGNTLQLLQRPGRCHGTHGVLVKCGHKGRRGGEGGRLAGGERVPRYIVSRAPQRRPQVSLGFPSCPCSVPHSSDWGAGPGCPARAPGSPPPPRQAGACIFQSPGAPWGDAPRTPGPAQCAEWKTAGRHVHAAGRRLHVDTTFYVLLGFRRSEGVRRLNSQQADQKTLRLRVLRVHRGMARMVVTFRTKFLLAKW